MIYFATTHGHDSDSDSDSDRSKPSNFLLGAISGILKCLHTVIISVHVRIHSRGENTQLAKKLRMSEEEEALVLNWQEFSRF